jgi:CHAD domain-containing protein
VTTARQFAYRQTRQLLEELRVQIARAAATGEEEAVHRTRVATRRWFAAAAAFDGYFDAVAEHAFRRTLKKIMQASSGVRDCDVAEKLLVRLQAEPGMLSKLAARRAKRSKRLAEVLQAAVTGGGAAPKGDAGSGGDALTGQLCGVSKLRPGAGAEPLPHTARSVLSAAFKDFLKRGERASEDRDARRLHKFRIHAKELRYTLELFSGTGTGFDVWIEPVRQVQSLLGDAHDCEAVRDMIDGSPGWKAVSARLKRRRDAKQRQFRRLWQERFARASIPHPRSAD